MNLLASSSFSSMGSERAKLVHRCVYRLRSLHGRRRYLRVPKLVSFSSFQNKHETYTEPRGGGEPQEPRLVTKCKGFRVRLATSAIKGQVTAVRPLLF